MIKEIVKNVQELSVPCEMCSSEEAPEIIKDLLDTANHYKTVCAGLAANQIAYKKKVICFRNKDKFYIMVNPRIMSHSTGSRPSTEGCLSLDYQSTVNRWQKITVMYKNEKSLPCVKEFRGLQAIEIQHEIDHLNGILI